MKVISIEKPLRTASIKTWIRKCTVDYVVDYVAKELADIEREPVELNENITSLKDISWDRIFSLIKKVFKYDSPSLHSPNLPELARYIESFLEISLNLPTKNKIKEALVTYCDLLSEDKGIKIAFLIKSMECSYPINVYLRKQLDLDSGENTIVCTTGIPLLESSDEDSDNYIKDDNSRCVTASSISSCKSCYNFSICKYIDDEEGPIDIAYERIKANFDFLDVAINCKYYMSKIGG